MTISTEPARLSYDGDDSTVAFPVTWNYFAKSHVVATLRDSTGAETTWVLDTDYTLTDADLGSGTLTATTAPATGEILVIDLDPPNTQDKSLPIGGAIPTDEIEEGLDIAAQRDAKLEALLNRTIRVPTSDSQIGSDLILPIDSSRASKALHFDSSGKPALVTPTDASGTNVTTVSGNTARSLAERFENVINVKDFGATGDGVTDDTAAINLAFAHIDGLTVVNPGGIYERNSVPAIYFPPGHYKYAPTSEYVWSTAVEVMIFADCAQSALIEVTTSNYLVEMTTAHSFIHYRDITMTGGKGYFRQTWTGTTPQAGHIFERCRFIDYTECALGSLGGDDPGWVVRDCVFEGTATSIGLFLPEGTARQSITGNTFSRNKYHIKTADAFQSAYTIGPNNIFYRTTSSETVADIWFTAIDFVAESYANIGTNVTVDGNRFSNENLSEGDKRILIAAEDTGSGSDGMDRAHSTSNTAATVGFVGLNFKNNIITGIGTGPDSHPSNVGFIYSYSPSIGALTWASNEVSAYYPYIVEFNTGITDVSSTEGCSSVFYFANDSFQGTTPAKSNLEMYGMEVWDDQSYRSSVSSPNTGGGYDYNQVVLHNKIPSTVTISAGTTRTNTITDSYGIANAASNYSFAASTDWFNLNMDATSLTVGENIWVLLDLQQGTANPLTDVEVQVKANGSIIHSFDIPVNASWRPLEFCQRWPTATTPTILITGGIHHSASTKEIQMCRYRVIQCNRKPDREHLQALDGTWDGAHLILGAYHIWVDGTGDLRIKSGAPTSGTDGTVVGTQT